MDGPTHWSNTPAVGKSLEDVLACLSHTPVVGKSLGEAHICWSLTPTVDKTIREEVIHANSLHLQWAKACKLSLITYRSTRNCDGIEFKKNIYKKKFKV